ncbi:winged helix-turn-helix transcriptional regulator [Streptomyces scopuliridis]
MLQGASTASGIIYRLTPAGQALLPALRELSAWAEENLAP